MKKGDIVRLNPESQFAYQAKTTDRFKLGEKCGEIGGVAAYHVHDPITGIKSRYHYRLQDLLPASLARFTAPNERVEPKSTSLISMLEGIDLRTVAEIQAACVWEALKASS